jgi:hypothetical protein
MKHTHFIFFPIDDNGAFSVNRERIVVGSLSFIPKDSGGAIPAFSTLAEEKIAIISFNRYSSL